MGSEPAKSPSTYRLGMDETTGIMFVAGPVGPATILLLGMVSKFGEVRITTDSNILDKGLNPLAVGFDCAVQITAPAPSDPPERNSSHDLNHHAMPGPREASHMHRAM